MSGDLNAHAVDSVQGLGEIVAFQHVRARGEEFAAKAREYLAVRVPFLRDLTLQSARQEVATGLGGLAVVLAGAWLAASGRLDGGMLPLLTLLAMSAFVPVWEIAQVGRQLADTLGAARRVYAVHAEPVPVTDGPGVRRTSGMADIALEMTRVSFAYPGRRRRALTDVSLQRARGQHRGARRAVGGGQDHRRQPPPALLGSGRGRGAPRTGTTCASTGSTTCAGASRWSPRTPISSTTRCAATSCSPGPGPARTELLAAVDKAALDDFVAALPDGLDTVVGERGAQLSGGQRQRVAIARAFLKDAPILILDEATSHLDAVNEQAVRAALDVLARDRTTVVIAHRLSTVRDADQIIVLDDGRVAEVGAHASLLARGGLYAHLVSRQLTAAVGSERRMLTGIQRVRSAPPDEQTPTRGVAMMERQDSVVTPERFASGRTFEQYLAFIGTPDNLAREGSASGPRRDQTAAMRAWYEANRAHRRAGGGHPLARESARRPRQDPGDLGGVVVGLPARRADARARGRGGGDGAAHLHARRPALQRERAAEPGRGARQQCRPHGGVPERQERADAGSRSPSPSSTRRISSTSTTTPSSRRSITRTGWSAATSAPRGPGRRTDETRARADREFRRLQQSPFFRLWASAAVDEIISALHRRLVVGAHRRRRTRAHAPAST